MFLKHSFHDISSTNIKKGLKTSSKQNPNRPSQDRPPPPERYW
jgi:hypothetical protein